MACDSVVDNKKNKKIYTAVVEHFFVVVKGIKVDVHIYAFVDRILDVICFVLFLFLFMASTVTAAALVLIPHPIVVYFYSR
jgi:hypothetical protein